MVYVEVSFIKIPEFPQATVWLEAIADNPNIPMYEPDNSWFSAFLIRLKAFLNALTLKACIAASHSIGVIGYYSLA